MSGAVSSAESQGPRAIPTKRSFAHFDDSEESLLRPSTTKRPRTQFEEAKHEANTIHQDPKPHPLKRRHASFLENLGDSPLNLASKRYRPESVDSSVAQWIESVSGSETYRERHCRSDTLLSHSDGDIIPRRLTRSAPSMDNARDADGFVMPPTPASWNAPSVAPSRTSSASSSSSRKKNLVEDPTYRVANLGENNIYMLPVTDEFPEDIAKLVDSMRQDRDSPAPSLDEVRQDSDLNRLEMGTGEPAVERYFHANIFPTPKSADSLERTDRNPMARHVVPDVGSKLKVSTPVPDMLYGYSRLEAFPKHQAQLRSLENTMIANSQDLIYPFFVVEFKADGPGGSGSLWVATNQCLGASVSCVNIAERLNHEVRQSNSVDACAIGSAAFSIAMSGTEARLYVSWRDGDLNYNMRKVKGFLLSEAEQFLDFRKFVRNILDWGSGQRLNDIRRSLDRLLEANTKTASQEAGTQAPLLGDAASSSTLKRKSSSSRTQNARARAVQGDHSSGSSESYWKLDASSNRHYHIDVKGNIVWADDQPSSAQ